MSDDATKRIGELEKMERAVEFGIENLYENQNITKEQFTVVDKFEIITELAKEMLYENYLPDDLIDPSSDALEDLLGMINDIAK